MKFTMAVDKVVPTDFGHTIDFKKGEPTHVPKECWRAVQQAGAVPEDQEKVNAAPKKKDAAPDDPDARDTQIVAALKLMVESNKREEFTGSGAPKVEVISQLTGFDVDAKERDRVWTKFVQDGGTQ